MKETTSRFLKIAILLICLLFCAMALSSCDFAFRGSLSDVDLEEAYYILRDCTYGFTSWPDADALRFDYAEVMETDQYGRRLIRYSGSAPQNKNGDNVASCLLICQKISGGHAYYYEDICWIGTSFLGDKKVYADFSQQEINTLKEKNDWGLPIDTSKMKKVCYTVPPSKPELPGIKESAIEHFGLKPEMHDKIGRIPFGKNGDGMYFVWITVDLENYFCVVDPTDSSIVLSEHYEGHPLQCQDAIHAFKLKHGFIE